MKFLKENSYILSRLLVTQLGMMIFAIVLSTAAASFDGILLFVSIFSILFYLVLLYVAIWPLGASDVIRVDAGRQKKCIGKGFLLGTLAAAPSLFLILLMAIGYIFGHSVLVSSGGIGLYGVSRLILGFWQAPYLGLSNALLPSIAETGACLVLGMEVSASVYYLCLLLCQLLFVLPAILVTGVGYIFGHKNIALMSPLQKPKNQ